MARIVVAYQNRHTIQQQNTQDTQGVFTLKLHRTGAYQKEREREREKKRAANQLGSSILFLE